jgi:hypothetical protein
MGGKGYKVNSISKNDRHQYFFESVNPDSGIKIFKVIEYTNLNVEGIPTAYYNLGFGDYDRENDEIIDDILTNNGDPYSVFNTVLHTVPEFFARFPQSVLMVGGSDSAQEFEVKCRELCRKSCGDSCKNKGRRIRTYCQYVSKYYIELSSNYMFGGGILTEDGLINEVPFEQNELYEVIFVYKK